VLVICLPVLRDVTALALRLIGPLQAISLHVGWRHCGTPPYAQGRDGARSSCASTDGFTVRRTGVHEISTDVVESTDLP
jgi:hypothetical protein